jgi:hypothetical protein
MRMGHNKRDKKTKQRIQAGRDVNLVELGVNAMADQVAAGETVKQKQSPQLVPTSRDMTIASNALRAAAELASEPSADATLNEEIKMLRQLTKQVASLIQDAEPDRAPALLNALSLAATRVAKLLKAQKELSGKSGGLVELLQRALREVLEEKRAKG